MKTISSLSKLKMELSRRLLIKQQIGLTNVEKEILELLLWGGTLK